MSSQGRKWTVKRKMDVVLELLKGGDAATISRNSGISQNQLFEWRDNLLAAGAEGLKARKPATDKKVRQLERLVGRLTMENEILKKTERLQRRRK